MTHPFQPRSPFPSPSLATAWAVEILSVSISFLLGEMQQFSGHSRSSTAVRCLFLLLLGDEIRKSWNGKTALKFSHTQQSFVIKARGLINLVLLQQGTRLEFDRKH